MKNIAILALSLFSNHYLFGAHPVKFEMQLLTVDANEGIAVADYDRDGKLDISAGRNWYRNPGKSGVWVPRPLRIIEDRGGYAHSNGEHAYDVDGDGWIDVVSNSFWLPEVNWYRNPGERALKTGLLWEQNLLIDTKQKHNELCQFIDIDGDGKREWIANQWNKQAPMMVWSQDDKGDFKGHMIGPHNGHGIGFGDLNNDGRSDIVIGTGWYERPEGNPYSRPWKFHQQSWPKGFSCPVLIRDVNGDGKNDLLWGNGHDYGVYAWLSRGVDENGNFLYNEVKIDDSFSQAHALHFADLDGDGVDELITGKRVYGHNGRDPGADDIPVVMYYTWDKKFKTIRKHVAAKGAGIGLHIVTADLDADGDFDIVVPGKEGTQILWNKSK